jgi:hypothetical protein
MWRTVRAKSLDEDVSNSLRIRRSYYSTVRRTNAWRRIGRQSCIIEYCQLSQSFRVAIESRAYDACSNYVSAYEACRNISDGRTDGRRLVSCLGFVMMTVLHLGQETPRAPRDTISATRLL